MRRGVDALGREALAGPERVAVVGRPQNGAADEVTGVIQGCVLHGVILSRKDNVADGGGGMPVLGNTTQLAEVINREQLDRILIMDERLDPEELHECARISRRMGITMNRLIGITDSGFEVRFAISAHMPMLELKLVSFTRTQEVLKRVLDVVVSAACLILLSLPILLIAILIRITSAGPVLHRAPRELAWAEGISRFTNSDRCTRTRTAELWSRP